ncbi:MAG: AAA family ATPase [Saprospiraceae bacterium]
MQKIVIKNFGPIRDAEIEIKPITVLLGEQATGKSTVAQLVHFFCSLGDEIVREPGMMTAHTVEDVHTAIVQAIRKKFLAFFGPVEQLRDFEVVFFATVKAEKFIKIARSEGWLEVEFSAPYGLKEFKEHLIEHLFASGGVLVARLEMLAERVYPFLWGDAPAMFYQPVYFIAGRNVTTTFSETFRAFFAENYRYRNGHAAAHSALTSLTSNFMLHSAWLKDSMIASGGGFEQVLNKIEYTDLAKDFSLRLHSVLKGKFQVLPDGAEVIHNEDGARTFLVNASSGQQESIRILQDLALLCAYEERAFRTIEEPEAHLFPSAQNALTDLLVMTHNRTGSHFFLTTHSPYFLSSFNNLLYAAKAAGDNLPEGETPNPERLRQVEELGYPKHLRLKASDFAAYQLKDGTAESIFNPDSAITDIDGLDAVSFEIATKFEALVEIVKEAEAHETA